MATIDSQSLIDCYFGQFSGLRARAARSLRRGRLEEAAAYVELAAQYAWFHPTGILASPELEDILAQVADHLHEGGRAASGQRASTLPQVLHVATEVYGIGGHSRLIWRWMRADTQHCHSLILTRQMESEIPSALEAAVDAGGGVIHYLDRQPGGILTRAQALRQIAAAYDHVVIHAHPWDVIPSLALLHWPNRPAVTHVNKDDHVFFLGLQCADQIAHMREAGARLCRERRGGPPGKLLPLPLDAPAPRLFREEARRLLGIADDTVVLLSVASAYKYCGGAPHFADLVTPLLLNHANALLFVIGPAPTGEWARAQQECQGRIRVLGKQGDAALYHRAADIYLDSFPLASLTSCLESGLEGTPIVSYWQHSAEAETLCADDPALKDVLIRAASPEEYKQKVAELLANPGLRRQIGRCTQERILSTHTSPGWKSFLDAIYAVGGGEPRGESSRAMLRRQVSELDLVLARTYALAGLSNDLQGVLRDHLGMFPLPARLRLWAAEFRCSLRELPSCLLSDGLKTRLRLLGGELAANS